MSLCSRLVESPNDNNRAADIPNKGKTKETKETKEIIRRLEHVEVPVMDLLKSPLQGENRDLQQN